MASTFQCADCGRIHSTQYQEVGENGRIICRYCKQKELDELKMEDAPAE